MTSDAPTRFVLPQERMPTAWYNALPDLPAPLQPPLHPGTKEPAGPADLAPLFPMALIEQEMTQAPTVEIPGEVIDILRLWRPTPLVRARRLEEALGTPARIYYKDESGSPSGSHKTNTAVAQAFYNQQDGTKRIATETGAGQWGARCRSRARSSTSSARCTWSARRTSRSRTGACSWRRGARPSCRRRSTSPTNPAHWAVRSATPCATRRRATTPTTRSGPC